MGDLKILKAKNNDVNPYTDEVVRELHEFLSRKNYEKVFVVSPFDAHYEHRWTNNVFFKALNGGDFDFDIYLYEVSNLLPDEWINTFHTFNGEKKKKIFDLFISQKVAMDFDIFLQLNRFKGLPLGEKSFVELFSKLSVKEYKKLMESFSEEEIKEKLPRRIANHRTFYKVLRDNK